MTVLIIGTPDSGKSKRAEEIAVSLSRYKKKYYIATMIPYGKEGEERVKKHLKLRDGKGFITVEKSVAVHELIDEIADLSNSTCLLECMSNLIGNEMHREEGASKLSQNELLDTITDSVMKLALGCENLIIVSNKFFQNDSSYDEDTRNYVKLVDMVNDKLRQKVDMVHELIEGEWKISENP